jgi:aminopeptidase-like protein
VLTACRPQSGFSVKEIYVFEVLSSTEWQTPGVKTFYPNVFMHIGKTIHLLDCFSNIMTKMNLQKIDGSQMIGWMKDMWNYPRSLTGHGTRKTLEYLKGINPELNIHSFKSGLKVFDWEIPDEWNIYDAYIEHESGKKFAEFKNNNLHILGYSIPCDMYLSLARLLPHIYTQQDQPNVIPYVTSYYDNNWGFCMSENDKQDLPEGKYHIVIDAKKGLGTLELADLVIRGESSEEIFFSTYVCHPSMANNELSGPVLSTALIQYIKSQYPSPKYTYRFVFVPETIGAVTYLSKHLDELQKKVICGFNLSCVGDNRAYSYIESRMGGTLADKALQAALVGLDSVVEYSFLDRGSDERQYCSPGVDLPLCGFSRTKYGEYPEYHTSADNFDVVTADGLHGSLDVVSSIIDAFEMDLFPKTNNKCEPQLGKRGLRLKIVQKGGISDTSIRSNFIAYADGNHSLFDISIKINKNLKAVITEATLMVEHGLITLYKNSQPSTPL